MKYKTLNKTPVSNNIFRVKVICMFGNEPNKIFAKMII